MSSLGSDWGWDMLIGRGSDVASDAIVAGAVALRGAVLTSRPAGLTGFTGCLQRREVFARPEVTPVGMSRFVAPWRDWAHHVRPADIHAGV